MKILHRIYNVQKAVEYLNQSALELKLQQSKQGYSDKFGCGYCARYVRLAIKAGGISLKNYPRYAKNYDPYLGDWGFIMLAYDTLYSIGDIAVIQPHICKGGNGHIQMYNGKNWVSDFVQLDFWPGPSYRKYKPSFSVFRMTSYKSISF